MPANPWHDQRSFRLLCDLVASDRLVCLTGAGISVNLPQADNPSKKLPGWRDLLEQLSRRLRSKLNEVDRRDCDQLLNPCSGAGPISGRHLIMAASILRAASPKEFDKVFRRAIRTVEGSYSDTHAALLEMRPRGVVTFNYDNAHEAAAQKALAEPVPFQLLLPRDEEAFAQALSGKLEQPFLLKAHDSIDSANELILTQESYRHILAKAPAYSAFFQNLLTNFHFLVVGFGLDDPDFDLFVDTVVNQYGSPLHEHVVIRHQNQHGRNEVLLRRRYGFHTLYVSDWAHIPLILRDATRMPGPRLRATIKKCLSPVMKKRVDGHRELAELGPAGKAVASASLWGMMDEQVRKRDSFAISEIAYSLGRIDPRMNKDRLVNIVETAFHTDPVGRALTVLREALEPTDVRRLKLWRRRFAKTHLEGPRQARLLVYLDYLIEYVPNKYNSFKLPKKRR